MRKIFWDSKPWQAFKTFAIIFSFTVNVILILVLLIASPLIIPIVNDIVEPLVGDLNDSFVMMNDATITQVIPVRDAEAQVEFTLPLKEQTIVTLTSDVVLRRPAQFILPGGGGAINGDVILVLPKGQELPVELNLPIEVSQTITIASMDVLAEIPLDETDLGTPFRTLTEAFAPLNELIRRLPSSNQELFERISRSNNSSSVEETAVESNP
jgi:hypothetical protein